MLKLSDFSLTSQLAWTKWTKSSYLGSSPFVQFLVSNICYIFTLASQIVISLVHLASKKCLPMLQISSLFGFATFSRSLIQQLPCQVVLSFSAKG
jgi:hypothetical protein